MLGLLLKCFPEIQLVLQFKNHFLGSLLSDSLRFRDALGVIGQDRKPEIIPVHLGENAERSLRPDAADTEKKPEDLKIVLTQKAIELHRILAHGKMRVKLPLFPDGEFAQRAAGHENPVAYALVFYDDGIRTDSRYNPLYISIHKFVYSLYFRIIVISYDLVVKSESLEPKSSILDQSAKRKYICSPVAFRFRICYTLPMITTKKNAVFPPSYCSLKEGDAVLDITSSGRYWRTSRLLKTDLILQTAESAVSLTWETEKEEDEYELLKTLTDSLSDAKRIITYNGHSFDLPHLRNKYRAYGLPDPFQGKEFLDLFLALKGTASFFALPSRKLSDFAALMGIKEDTCSDAAKTAQILSLLKYEAFLKEEPGDSFTFSADDERLLYEMHAAGPFPKDLSVHDEIFHIRFFENGTVRLSARIRDGRIRIYHTDIKNYEYLPAEGYAVHRTMSAFVDKSRKVPASRETCYHLAHVSPEFLHDTDQQLSFLRSALAYLRTRFKE